MKRIWKPLDGLRFLLSNTRCLKALKSVQIVRLIFPENALFYQSKNMAPFLIASYDIECNSSHGDFLRKEKQKWVMKFTMPSITLENQHHQRNSRMVKRSHLKLCFGKRLTMIIKFVRYL